MSESQEIFTRKRLGKYFAGKRKPTTDTMRTIIFFCALFACGLAATYEGGKQFFLFLNSNLRE